jgi:hypothetical protein
MEGTGSLGALFDEAAEAPPDTAELAFYEARLPRDRGNVLAAPCGAGRLLVPLLESGFAMHGIEPSAALLDACVARVRAAHREATLVRQSLDEINLPFRFAAVIVPGGAFQRLTDPVAARTALARLRAHLVAPAILVLEMTVPSEGTQRLGAPLVELRTAQLADGSRIALRSETTMYAEERIARALHRYVHRRGAAHLAEEHASWSTTWYPPDEMGELVAEAGFARSEIGPPPRAPVDGDAYSVIAYG